MAFVGHGRRSVWALRGLVLRADPEPRRAIPSERHMHGFALGALRVGACIDRITVVTGIRLSIHVDVITVGVLAREPNVPRLGGASIEREQHPEQQRPHLHGTETTRQ